MPHRSLLPSLGFAACYRRSGKLPPRCPPHASPKRPLESNIRLDDRSTSGHQAGPDAPPSRQPPGGGTAEAPAAVLARPRPQTAFVLGREGRRWMAYERLAREGSRPEGRASRGGTRG